jgi:predicted transposase/invertase (TIGR01784 family)
MKKETKNTFQRDGIIDIRYDSIFKAVFTQERPESRQALSKLISAFIEKDVTVETLYVNEPPVKHLENRNIRFDINCKTENNERINVEMTLNPKPYEPVRLEYYSGILFTSQNIKGVRRNYKHLKRTYQIAILAKERFFDDDNFYHSFEYYDPIRNVSLNGKTRIITIELCKVKNFENKPTGEMSLSELWAYYFEYLTDIDKSAKIKEITEREGGISMIGHLLKAIDMDELEYLQYISEMKYELDRQSELSYERDEGQKEASKQIARNALAEGFTFESIQKITGLDMETIKSLQPPPLT